MMGYGPFASAGVHPTHWDFTNLLVWPPPQLHPEGERNVIWPAVMRQSHTLCAHRYLKLFPFRGSLWVLRRYHPQMTVGFSPAIPLTWKEGLCLSRLFTSTHWNSDGALPALLLNEPFTLSMATLKVRLCNDSSPALATSHSWEILVPWLPNKVWKKRLVTVY